MSSLGYTNKMCFVVVVLLLLEWETFDLSIKHTQSKQEIADLQPFTSGFLCLESEQNVVFSVPVNVLLLYQKFHYAEVI